MEAPKLESRRIPSPSGRFTLLIQRKIWPAFVDTSIGFDGYAWHTHADMLASWFKCGDEAALDCLLAGLFSGKHRIWIQYNGHVIADVGIEWDRQHGDAASADDVKYFEWSDI